MIEIPATINVAYTDKNNAILTENTNNSSSIDKNDLKIEKSSMIDNKNNLKKSLSIDGSNPDIKLTLSNKNMGMTKELPKETKKLLSMSKSYKSTGNINFNSDDPNKTNTLRNRQNLLKSTAEKNSKYHSSFNLRTQVGLKHSNSSLYFPSVGIEGNSRQNEIRKLRKTFTSPHIYNSSESFYSETGSSESILSSTLSIGSDYSICDSCDSICESILDLLERKDAKRFTEMENGHLKLIKYNQCPDWLADNPYIHTNYRPPCYSYKACYKSLFYLHNETGNIYTHLIGTILFTSFYIFTAYAYIPSFHELDSLQILSIVMSVIGGFICMYFSSHFHLFSSHSLKVNRNWLTCDFIGIVSLIYTTGLPLSYYSFYCIPDFRVKYMAVSAIIGAISLLAMLNPVFSRDEYRLVRSGLFFLLAASELIPIAYALIFFNQNILINYLSVHWVGAGTFMYLIGLILYAKRIPEFYFPGKFDVWGHSHQIFHSLILFASISFYIGIMKTVRSYNLDDAVCTKLY